LGSPQKKIKRKNRKREGGRGIEFIDSPNKWVFRENIEKYQ